MKTIDLLVQELPALGGFPEGAVEAGFLCSDDTLYFVNKEGNCPSEWRISMNYEVEDGWVEVTREQYDAALAASKRCDHNWVPSEGRTQSGYLCSKCGNYDGPGYDWIDWPGGECPVPTGTLVDVRYRNGEENHHIGAGISFAEDWNNDGSPLDIIAYRLHKSQEVTEADDEADLNECIGQELVTTWSGEGLPQVGCECEYRKHKKHEQSEWFNGVVKYASEFTVVIQPVCYPGETVGHPANFEFRPIRSEAEQRRHDAAQALCYAGGGIGKVDESAGIGSCWFDVYDAIAAGKIPGVKLED